MIPPVAPRLRGCDLETHFIYDADIERELRQRFGPDELTLELEGNNDATQHPQSHTIWRRCDALTHEPKGPELVWMPQRHVGECAYEFEYKVERASLYRLVGFSYRGGYGSLNEIQEPEHYFPPLQYDDLTGEWAWIDLNLYDEGDEGHPGIRQERAEGRPKCARLDAPGRWVHYGGGARVWLSNPLQHKPRPHGTYRKWLVDPRQFRWQPYGCDAPEYAPHDVQQCLSGRSIQFRGDSHTRVLMAHFAYSACGSPFTDHVPACLAAGRGCNNSRLCRAFDTVGMGEMEHRTQQVIGFGPESVNYTGYSGWDTLVINFGHHQSSSLWRMKQREYRERVDFFLDNLLEGQRRVGFKVIFWSSVAAHTQRNPNIITLRDWRTLHRIQSFNEYVERRIKGTPIQFLDIHQASLSFRDALLCTDHAHYNDPYPQHFFVQLILWALCDPPSHPPV